MNFLETVTATSNPVVVFGASVMGKILLDSLELLNVGPVCFCDNDLQKQSKLFHGYEVISFEKLCTDHSKALLVIAAGRFFNEIREQLSTAGFVNIFSDADIIGCIDFKKTPYSKLQKIIWHLAKLGKLAEIMDLPAGSLHIPRLNVVVTSRCTLKCRHCSSLIPHYGTSSDFDTSTILTSLDRIFACADLVYHVELLGGEPFLNKNLSVIAKHLLDSERVLHMDVITNGTVLPPDSVLKTLKHDTVSVVIDDYGKLSKKADGLSDALKYNSVDFRVNKHWAWADLGGFERRNLTLFQLTERFKKCNFNSCTELLNGRLHRCPRSSHGTQTEVVPDYPEDFINISDSSVSVDILKEKLKSFLYDRKFIHACDHCNGNTGTTLKLAPAEQQT
jgi:hypothetical protein